MYDRPNLGLGEAVRGLLAALEVAKKDEAEGRPVVVAIVDHKGELVCYARQDACLEMSKEMAVRKAYTAAIGRRNSADYAESKDSNATAPPHFSCPRLPLPLFAGDPGHRSSTASSLHRGCTSSSPPTGSSMNSRSGTQE